MARGPICGAGVPTAAREAVLAFCCALALVPGAWAQSLPWLLNPNAGPEASAKVTFRYPWGSFEVETAPVRPSDAATVVVFPGVGSDESWRRISRQLSAVLGKLPGGEAEVWLLDGSTARGLGKLSRRTPAQRLIPVEARTVVISGGSESSAAAVQPVNADPADAQAETQAAGTFTPGMQAQAIEWLESEPRGWALSIWLAPDSTFDGESRDFFVARLLRAAARSQTRLRLEIPGTEPNAAATTLPTGLPMDLAETELLAVFRPERDVRLADAPEMAVALLPPVRFPEGFHLHRLGVKPSDSAGVPATEIELPWLSVAEGTPAPDRSLFDRVSYLERRLLGTPVAGPAGEDAQSGAEPVRTALLAEAAHTVRWTLELNPAAFEVLRAGAAIARAMGHPATAVDYEARRLPAEPPRLERLEALGLAAFDALQLDLAKQLLAKAASLESANAAVWKALAVLSALGGADPDALTAR